MSKLSKRDISAFEGDDKYQGQKDAVPFGITPPGTTAFEPYKEGDQSDHSVRMRMYWDFVKDAFFEKNNRWSSVVQQLKKMYSEITPEEITELTSQVDYYLQQYKMQRQSSANTLTQVQELAQRLAPVSPTRMSLYKVLKQSFPKVDDKILHQVMRELVEEKKANFGFFDGPVDLGKNPSGDFPSVSWMPRGNEDLDVDPNITTASIKEATDMPLSLDEQKQIASKFGPEYNTAAFHYYNAIKNQHAPDKAIAYAVNEMKKVHVNLDEQKLLDVVNTYLKGR